MSLIIKSADKIRDLSRDQLLDEVMSVEHSAWPLELQASREKMEARLKIFPQGFFLAIIDGKIKGVSTSQIASYPSSAKTWDELTGNGFIKATHDLSGNALYVVSLGVDPTAQGRGIGSKLIEVQKQIAEKLGLEYLFLGARVPGFNDYCKNNEVISVDQYLNLKNEKGERFDPEIRFYERRDFTVGAIKPNFEPDSASKDYGILMVYKVK